MIDRFVFLCHCVLDLLILLFFLELGEPGVVAEALMADGASALEAVSDFAGRALVRLQALVLEGAEIVTVVRAALKVGSGIAGLHDHFPLKSLPPVELLLVQEDFEVVFGLEGV